MKLKFFLQIILVASIFIILFIFYYNFFLNSNIIKKSEILSNDLVTENMDDTLMNELLNIEYNSTDNQGNTFYINSERATVALDKNQSNLVNLEGVVSIINLKNKGIINIYSNEAIYNKLNHDTSFFNEVKIEYLNNVILSRNLDVIFSENISNIYNEVVYKNDKSILSADKISINMITGDIKFGMKNKSDKIKLITSNEFIN